MPINVNEAIKLASGEVKYLSGQQTGIAIANGKTLSIKTSPTGEDYLIRAPVAGKKWINGKITIYFEEVDI